MIPQITPLLRIPFTCRIHFPALIFFMSSEPVTHAGSAMKMPTGSVMKQVTESTIPLIPRPIINPPL